MGSSLGSGFEAEPKAFGIAKIVLCGSSCGCGLGSVSYDVWI